MEIDLFGNIIERKEEYVAEEVKANPFELLKNISNKNYPESTFGFNKFLTNLGMSQRSDTVLFANEMNKYDSLSDQICFDFYYHGLPKKNYFAKWAKKFTSDYTDMVKEYFSVSHKVAKQYEKILDKEQLEQIKQWYNNRKGGK
jgi:hypothetical protein